MVQGCGKPLEMNGRNERRVKFWKDLWCDELTLKEAFPNLFRLAVNKDGQVSNLGREWVFGQLESPFFKTSLRLGVEGSGGFVQQITTLDCEKRSGGRYEPERQ